jgi:hypothetical protein
VTDVPARPPQWAVREGLPPAVDGETLRAYCERIGVDYQPLVEGITDDRSLDCANLRLGHVLRQRMPKAWDAHIRSLIRKWS